MNGLVTLFSSRHIQTLLKIVGTSSYSNILKVRSSEMDPAEIRLIRRVFPKNLITSLSL
jgi:hypothetical protein